jgi:GT2 family glycosyltransferase
MTATTSRRRISGHRVTAVLVCHDGERWLPEVLAGLVAQTRQPDRLVATDTDSRDGSARLVTEVFGEGTVVPMPRRTPLGAAVQAGLDAFGPQTAAAVRSASRLRAAVAAGTDQGAMATSELDTDRDTPVEWIWLLHDDCAPEPTALEELLLRVEQAPSAWMAGPKVRAWDGARLLEAGLTIDRVGTVDTGFDGVELDQGQCDDLDQVLAVGTAGALIRRDVWDRLGGLDPAWSTYGDDVDLGWRINAAGGRVVIVPRSVVRHVRAQTIGRRRSAVHPGWPIEQQRRSGMQVVLTNTSRWLVPLLLLRYAVGGALRSAGLLVLAARPANAAAEIRAVIGVFAHPRLILTGRRDRSAARTVAHHDLRELFPSASRRWRSSPLLMGRVVGRRASIVRSQAVAESGPVSEEAESLSTGDGVIMGFLRRPTTSLVLVMTLVALLAERHVIGGTLHGGRLLPAPAGSRDLWSTYVAAWHPSSVGSTVPAPPSIAILAAAATVLFGKAWLVVDLIVLGAVPLAALSAYRASGALTSAVRVRQWVALVYSLLPAVTGAVAGGRIDVAVVAILLPQVIRAGAVAVAADSKRPAWRRGITAGLLLGLVSAFAPLLWVLAVPAFVIGIGFAEREAADHSAILGRLLAGLVALAIPLAVLAPWSGYVIEHPHLLVAGTGLPEFFSAVHAPGFSLALLRAGGPAQPPVWIGIPILAAALLGLTRQSRVALARTGAALLVIGVAVAVAMSRGAGVTAGLPASRHWPGIALLVAGAGALLAALVAAVGARPALAEKSFGWRQPAAVAIVILAVVSTGTLVVGFIARGAAGPLTNSSPAVLPLFTQSELDVPTTPRALVLDATSPTITYALVRRPGGPVLGDADTAPAGDRSGADVALDDAVRDLVAGRPGAGAELAPLDIKYVVVPNDSARRVSSALGRTPTLTVVPAPGAIVWRSSLPTGELTVTKPVASSGLGASRTAVGAVSGVLDASAGSADVRIPAGPPGRVAVLAEPAAAGWRATVDGTRLASRTAYGWAQAFELPAAGGQLRIGYADTSRHRWLWAELAVTVLLVLIAVSGRRPDDEDSAP